MMDWIGIGGLVLLLLALSLYGLFKDRDPRSMNPRPFVVEERKSWLKFQRTNFVVFLLAIAAVFLVAAFIRWIWIR